MEERKFSLKDIQRIARLSATSLEALLDRHRHCLSLEVREDADGNREILLDQASFERLLFFKQLDLKQGLSPEEAAAGLRIPQLKDLFPKEKPTFEHLTRSLEGLSTEVNTLRGSFQTLLSRYYELVNELQEARSDNAVMSKELGDLREKQRLLVKKLHQEAGVPESEAEDPPVLN